MDTKCVDGLSALAYVVIFCIKVERLESTLNNINSEPEVTNTYYLYELHLDTMLDQSKSLQSNFFLLLICKMRSLSHDLSANIIFLFLEFGGS